MEQPELLTYVIDVLENLRIPYMVVGAVASGAYGEPRLTRDIDIVVDLRPELVQRLCAAFPPGEFYVSDHAATEAVQTCSQFNVIHPASGNKVDFMVARPDAWGRTQLSRRQRVHLLPDRDGYAARPEDVIISKMDYYRQGGSEKHLRDVTGILKVSGEEVDRAYVTQWSRSLGLSEIWQAILRRLGERGP